VLGLVPSISNGSLLFDVADPRHKAEDDDGGPCPDPLTSCTAPHPPAGTFSPRLRGEGGWRVDIAPIALLSAGAGRRWRQLDEGLCTPSTSASARHSPSCSGLSQASATVRFCLTSQILGTRPRMTTGRGRGFLAKATIQDIFIPHLPAPLILSLVPSSATPRGVAARWGRRWGRGDDVHPFLRGFEKRRPPKTGDLGRENVPPGWRLARDVIVRPALEADYPQARPAATSVEFEAQTAECGAR
jgi:hypothetical protein